MTAEPLLVVGAALVLGGALAAARRLRFAGVARPGRTVGLAVAGTGLLCLVAGLILLGGEGTGAKARAFPATITAELDEGVEVSEEIRVFLDGRDVGIVRVDERRPVSKLALTVDRTGRHEYRLESIRQRKGHPPERARRADRVDIDRDGRLGIFYGPEGEVYLLAL